MMHEEIAPGVLYFKQAIKNNDILLELFESVPGDEFWTDWEDWNSYDKSNEFPIGKMRNLSRKIEHPNKQLAKLVKDLDYSILTCVEEYLNYLNLHSGDKEKIKQTAFKASITDRGSEYYNIKRYDLGREMGPHPDWDPESPTPAITVALYFNDNYEGGTLSFNQVGASVKPEAGSVCIFPAYYFHQSDQMIDGIKYLSTDVLVITGDVSEEAVKMLPRP